MAFEEDVNALSGWVLNNMHFSSYDKDLRVQKEPLAANLAWSELV